MGVAALSTSAIALATTSAPAPAAQASGEATGTFAKLVTRAGPDDKAPGDPRPETGSEAENEDMIAAEDGVTASTEDGDPEIAVDQSGDLLAKIQAMAIAASQMFVSQPVSTPPAATTTTTATATATATTITTPAPTAAPVATTPGTSAAPPIVASPQAATAAAPTLPAPAIGASPIVTGQPAPSVETDSGGEATPVPAKASAGNDIASLIAALKAKLGGTEEKAGQEGLPIAARPTTDRTVAPAPASQPVPSFDQPAESADPTPRTQTPQAPIANTAPRTETMAPIATPMATASPIDTIIAEATQPTESKRTAASPTASPELQPTRAETADTPAGTSDSATTPAAETATAPATASSDATPAPTPLVSAPQPGVDAGAARTTTPVADANGMTANGPDDALARQIDVEHDNQWFDRLARDISQAAGQQGPLKFQLNPHNLGTLAVEIANDAAGTAIRFTTDNEDARAIIADAQPRLIAEVRAQGLRVAETHVEVNQQQNNAGGNGNGGNANGAGGSTLSQGQAQGQNRHASEDHKPFARTQAVIRDESADAASRDEGELYA